MKKFITLVYLVLIVVASEAQVQVNGYAKVTAILGPVITVGETNETYDQFNIGDRVLVMQMQDNVIGSNTGNNSNFGNLANIQNAGRYEFATIALVARVGPLLNVITLTGNLNNTYSLGPNSSVQIITFPTLGTPNFTTASNISALSWNGNIGGVVAFNVNGKLLLAHNITADGAGFRGGASDGTSSTHANCESATFFAATNVLNGNKGESIYKVTNNNYAAAMGRMITGGGGGNGHNGGGGGGSNYTGGGDGGMGYGCTTQSGGVGGVPLNSNITGHRFFMGGGGGSGEANNSANTKGGNGGGIIFIKAVELQTIGTGARRISANGQNGNNVGNDGAGGGGAGGTVLTEVFTWTLSASAPLSIQSNGGVGGNVGDGSRHGGGGGGGQGTAVFTSIIPVTNITVSTANGTGGFNSTNGTRAASGLGTNGGGIITSTFLILPVKLISFTAATQSSACLLQWTTANEQSFGYYEVQLSKDGNVFTTVGKVQGKGQAQNSYDYVATVSDDLTRYYRLRMVDADGKFTYSKIIVVRKSGISEAALSIHPNPATNNPVLTIRSAEAGVASIAILNMHGSVIAVDQSQVAKGDNPIVLQTVNQLAAGVYHVRVTIGGKTSVVRLIVQK